MAVFITVFSGTLVYVLGQIILKFFIEPVHELKKTIGVISHSLIERARIIYNPGLELNDEESKTRTSQELRNLAARLQSHLYLIPCYSMTACIFRLPRPSDILATSDNLIGLANSLIQPEPVMVNTQRVKTICTSLGIFEPGAVRPRGGSVPTK
jgi:hypothetical protein